MTAYQDVLAYGYRKARAMGMGHHDAEDASQVAALRVSQREHTFDAARDAWPLVQVIVRQSVHEHVRRVYARPDTPSEMSDYDAPTHDTTAEQAMANVDSERVREVLDAALAGMSDSRRRVVELTMAGYTPGEIAEALGYDPLGGRVRQLRREAFDTLRPALEAVR